MIIDVMDLGLNVINFTTNYDNARQRRARKIYNYKEVTINNVNMTQEDSNKLYEVDASVQGNFDKYKVKLNIKNTTLIKSSCTCPDNEGGTLCKHILATCMEVIDPQEPSTEERRKEKREKERKEAEERYKLFLLKQEKAKKEREYRKKYSEALTMLETYQSQSIDIDCEEDNTKLDLDKIYKQAKFKLDEDNNFIGSLATNIKIEPRIFLTSHNTLDVSFKIGQTTMYVIKDLIQFYKDFQAQNIVESGKKLKFKASKESFRNEDKQILDRILEYSEMLDYQEQITDRYYYGYSRSFKTMKLLDKKIDTFLELLKGRTILFECHEFKDKEFKFTDEKLDLNVEIINNNEEEYTLKLNLNDYKFIESLNCIYVLYDGKIYTLELNESNVELLKTFENCNEILVPNDKKEEFSTYVLPKLEKYMNVISSEEDSNENNIVINKLGSKMYLDLDDKGNIKLKLTFCYNDKEFNVLEKNYENYIKENNVQRNIIEERKVLERLFLDGFEIVKNKDYFLLKNDDFIYYFLVEKIEGYMNDFEVLVTDIFKNKKVRRPRVSNISVKIDSDLLEMDMSKIDIDTDEIKKILQSYNIKKKYHKLKNGDLLQLDQSEDLDFLNDISNNLDVDFGKIDNGVLKLPVNRSVYLEKLLDKNKDIAVTKNDEYNKLISNISDKNFSDKITISKNFEKVLRPYQQVGYKWLKVLENYNFGGILADDMGLGKTLQVIALLESSLKAKDKKTSIVVCPSSLVLNWKAEVEKWCPKIKVLIIKGDAMTRKNLINAYDKYDLVITSYDLLKRDVLQYEEKKFKYIIADEAQYIKNFSTQNATSLKSLEGEVRFALTGTPIENSISELWSIFDFIMPGYLHSYNKFKKKFEEPILVNDNKETLDKLKQLIEPFVLRRIKKDVLTELPEKNITVLNSEMEKEQEKLYHSYMAQIKQEVDSEVNENGFEKSKLKILMLLTRLRQICCHPSLFIENYKGESGKLKQCMDIVNEAISSGHKILLFSQYTSMFEIIERELEKLNIKYYKLTGSTPVDKRVDMVESFNKNEDVKIFLISLKAGGTGLNLTSADVVIHYDPWWNLSSENQATDRAYRIGQKNSVQVYKLITSNTIEEKINKLQEKKAELSEKLLSTEETFINKLSKEEIMSLFE